MPGPGETRARTPDSWKFMAKRDSQILFHYRAGQGKLKPGRARVRREAGRPHGGPRLDGDHPRLSVCHGRAQANSELRSWQFGHSLRWGKNCRSCVFSQMATMIRNIIFEWEKTNNSKYFICFTMEYVASGHFYTILGVTSIYATWNKKLYYWST